MGLAVAAWKLTRTDNEPKVFQHAVAGAVKPANYKRLFNLTPDTIVTLADPRIVKKAFTR